MSWWRKANPGDAGSVDGWIKIRSIWRKTNLGDVGSTNGWLRIKSAWRYAGGGLWQRIFSGLDNPTPKSDVNLWFINPPYNSGSPKSIDEAFQNSKMYIQRGKWDQEPVYFEVRIQKKPLIGNWELLSPPGINDTAFTYLANQDYSDSDFEKIWPTTSTNWPMITLDDIKNKIKFRAQFKVFQSLDFSQTELDQLVFNFPSDAGVAPRLAFDLNPFNGEPIAEYPDLTNASLKQYGIKWRYNTSYFSEFDAIDVIGRQIVEVADLYGNIVIQPYEVPVGPGNPQLSVINYTQAMIDSEQEYEIRLWIVAEDYYYNGGLTLEQYKNDTEQTIKLFSTTFQPPLFVADPTITITNRTTSGFDASWFSIDATKYLVDIKQGQTSLPGYPRLTTDTSASIFGLSENTLYDVYVTAKAGGSDQFSSNQVTQCVRTLTTGIAPVLGEPYSQSASTFKVDITNFDSFLGSGWNFDVSVTNGTASISQETVSVTVNSLGVQSCVTVSASKINSDICVQSYLLANSNTVCETLGTYYCLKTMSPYPDGGSCSTFTRNYDASGSEDGFIIRCFLTPVCCASTVVTTSTATTYSGYSEFGNCIQCQRTRFRTRTTTVTTNTTNNLENCSSTTSSSDEVTQTSSCSECLDYQNCCCPPSVSFSNKQFTGVVEDGPCLFVTGEGNRIRRKTYWTATKTTVNSDCSQTVENNVSGYDETLIACCVSSVVITNKQFTGVVEDGPCLFVTGEGNRILRKTYWTATQTVTSTDCSSSSSQISGFDTSYLPCCTAGCTESNKSYTGVVTYGAFCSQGERSRQREYTATETCIDSSCNVLSQTTVTRNDVDLIPCNQWFCTNYDPDENCAGCSTFESTTNQSGSGSGYVTSCGQSGYPACNAPCVQYYCKTTRQETGFCSLSGPFEFDQSGNAGGFVTVCQIASSQPYTCDAPPPFFPFFPFFPPYFPFFPPYFPFFPFFPPYFPFFPPYFPFFPPYFPFFPFFPPFFPFFPPYFPFFTKFR